VLTGYIRFGLERPQSYEVMFMSESCELEKYAEPDLKRCYIHFVETVQQCLNRYNKQGKQQASMLFLGLHGFVSRHISLGHDYSRIEKEAAAYCDFLIRGVM